MRNAGRVRGLYRAVAVVFSNIVLALVAVNLVIAIGLRLATSPEVRTAAETPRNVWLAHHGYDKLSRYFAGMNEEELNQFLNQTWITEQHYAPFIELQTSEMKSKHYNAHKAGFRLIPNQGEWPPDPAAYNVFVFGGSTTLGAGAADDGTIPAKLQAALRTRTGRQDVKVYNFGTGAHFSTQERLYLDQLVLAGHVPSLAVFIDGLNDFYLWQGEPVHAGWYRNVFQIIKDFNWRHDLVYHARELLKKTPMGQLVLRFQPKEKPAAFWIGTVSEEAASDPARIDAVIRRYAGTQRAARALAREHGFDVLFVWQPVPFYGYPRRDELYRDFGEAVGEHRRSAYGYPAMRQYVDSHDMGNDFLWCADVQKESREILYVDHVHYNPRMADMIAQCIGDGLLRRGLRR